MWKNITLYIMLFILLAALQISCAEHKLTKQEQILFEQINSGNSSEVARLIEAGTKINLKDQQGYTPLHRAAAQGNCEIIEILIKNGAKIDSTDKGDDTPLHKAAQYGRLESAKLLIEKGADVNAKNNQDKTPIFFAAYSGNLDLVKLLVEKGAYIKIQGYTPLHEALRNSMLRDKPENNIIEMVEYFLNKGVDVNANGDLENGLEVTALHYVAMNGSKRIVELLIKKGAKVNARSQNGQTPLFNAAIGGNVEAAKVLLVNGANINARNNRNETPLHYAVMERSIATMATFDDRIEIVKLFLAHGADVNALNNSQYTPLHHAVGWGWFRQPPPTPEGPEYNPVYKTIIQLLLESGADPNMMKIAGRNLLLEIAKEKPEIIELLIKYGAKD